MSDIITSKRAEDLVPGDTIRRKGRTYLVEDTTKSGIYVALGMVRCLQNGSFGQRSWPTVAASEMFETREQVSA